MLLQSLLLIAVLTVFGGVLLESTLVSATTAFHAELVRAGESALDDATADFIAWARKNVREAGVDQVPVWAAAPQAIGPAPACAEAQGCKLLETIRWNVTGYSGATGAQPASSAQSLAAGLATSQDERRVSATLTVTITGAGTGQAVPYAIRSREITARIFHSAPYAAVTAERDATSQVGSIGSAEGDTAGYKAQNPNGADAEAAPVLSSPAGYVDTTITTTTDCVNTADNASPDALRDNNDVAYAALRNYGNLAWVYEVPCKPLQRVDPATAPAGYRAPTDNVYRSSTTTDATWSKNDANGSSFAW